MTLPPIIPTTELDNRIYKETGWIELELTLVNVKLEKYQTLIASGSLFFLSVLLNLFFASRVSKDISDPILDIARTVDNIKAGNLDSRVNTNAGGEIQTLESGINSMAISLKQANYEMQQNIEKATEDLRVAIETTEIKNAELDLARKAALESSRIKSEFLANMSHEIRTPLNGIIGFTNLLSKTQLNLRQNDYIQTIQKSSSGLLALINDILDFSKIEAGKLVLDKTRLSVRDIIQDVLTILGPISQEKNLELISLVYSDVPVYLIGDPLRLKQVITNLVNNAIKFTETGSVTVRCMLEEQRGQFVFLKISVTDTGIGLSKEQQQALFKAFSQADTSATRQFGGSGLGLAISKSLVLHMEGDIGLESEVGKGSTFWFTVKLNAEPQSQQKPHQDKLNGLTIAIYENHPTARLALYHQLNEWQVTIKEANSQTALLHLLHQLKEEKQTLDATIIGLSQQDCQNTDTLIFLQEIQTLGAGKLIALINTSDDQLVNLVRSKGIDLCLTKPTCFNRVYDGLTDLLIHKKTFPIIPSYSPALPPQLPLKSSAPQEWLVDKEAPFILAVDDNEANLKLLVTWLSDLNVNILQARSGLEALDLFDKHTIHLIFLDIQMPGMSGMQVLQHIRKREALTQSRTPIIALTAHALGGEKEALMAAGIDDYLTKPVTEEQIALSINSWVQNPNNNKVETESSLPTASSTNDQIEDDAFTENSEDIASSPFDVSQSLKLAGQKSSLAIEMMDMLLDSLEADKSSINLALEEENFDELLERVHKLHGATKYCGVPDLQKISELIEIMLKKNITAPIPNQIQIFNQEVETLLHWSEENDWRAMIRQSAVAS